MHSFIAKSLLCSGLMLVGGFSLYAQGYGYPPYGDNRYYRGPTYGRPYQDPGGMDLFGCVQNDLNRAAYDVYGSRRHVKHAMKEVADVQRQLSRGHFDRDEMGEAINAVQHVIDEDSIPEADRSILWRDVAQMRRFRAVGYENPDRW